MLNNNNNSNNNSLSSIYALQLRFEGRVVCWSVVDLPGVTLLKTYSHTLRSYQTPVALPPPPLPAKRALLYLPVSLQCRDSVWFEPVQVLCLPSQAVNSQAWPPCCVEKTPIFWSYLRLPALAIFLLLRLRSLATQQGIWCIHPI